MTQQGYRPGEEGAQWWKVAHHLDEAQLASVTAMANNVDDPTIIFAFQETIRQAQAILLEIFRAKGLLPAAIEAPSAVSSPIEESSASSMGSMPMPPSGMSMPMPPSGMSMPMPPSGMSMPMPPMGMSMPMPPPGMSMPMPPSMASAFDPFDPMDAQPQPRDPAIGEYPVEVAQTEIPPQEHVEPSVATPDVAVVSPEVSAQPVESAEVEV